MNEGSWEFDFLLPYTLQLEPSSFSMPSGTETMSTPEISVYLEHIRSFVSAQDVPLRPLTLLVGENSSGKSTFLAATAVVADRVRFPGRPDFNQPPFNLGTFETIATHKGRKDGREDTFTVGFSVGEETDRAYRSVRATYVRNHGQPTFVRFEGRSKQGTLTLEARDQALGGTASLIDSSGTDQPLALRRSSTAYQLLHQPAFGGGLTPILLDMDADSAVSGSTSVQYGRLLKFAESFRSPFGRTIAFAPIRTKPKRTYDDLSEDYSPEGDHVPRLLARLFGEAEKSKEAAAVRDALLRFGTESGLFKNIDVKRFGKSPEDPFQVQVNSGGVRVNLMDVGYGVSQALPLIVQSTLRRERSLLLIQQPEVHLHPRAQAALGTFFVDLVESGDDGILIETHSDYLVDRVRQEVARGRLSPDKVMILFFDKPRVETTVYPITLDRLGNVEGAPDQYRAFFLQEELRLLGSGGA